MMTLEKKRSGTNRRASNQHQFVVIQIHKHLTKDEDINGIFFYPRVPLRLWPKPVPNDWATTIFWLHNGEPSWRSHNSEGTNRAATVVRTQSEHSNQQRLLCECVWCSFVLSSHRSVCVNVKETLKISNKDLLKKSRSKRNWKTSGSLTPQKSQEITCRHPNNKTVTERKQHGRRSMESPFFTALKEVRDVRGGVEVDSSSRLRQCLWAHARIHTLTHTALKRH